MSGKIQLRIVVGIVFACGLASILAGLGHAIGRGAFSSQLLAGPLYIGLSIWLFRGSNTARIVLAVLFALALVLFIGLVLLIPYQDVTAFVFHDGGDIRRCPVGAGVFEALPRRACDQRCEMPKTGAS